MSPEELRAQLIAEANAVKGSQLPVAALDPTSPWMPDMDMAVAEALKRIAENPNAEQAGVIFQNPEGMYAYSIPLTMRSRDNFALNAQSSADRRLSGMWHIHPGDHAGDDSTLFSPNDVEVANKLGLPSYVQFQANGKLRRYTPKQTKTFTKRMPGSMQPVRVSLGDEVVFIPRELFAESVPQ